MTDNKTLTIVKPCAVRNGHAGAILDRITREGFIIKGLKMTHLCRHEAESFYQIHKEQPFFPVLIDFMVSGPVIAAILEKEHAVYEFRKLIGVTDSQKAAPGTIRKEFGTNTTMNAVHGSDSDINANREIRFFFSELEEMK